MMDLTLVNYGCSPNQRKGVLHLNSRRKSICVDLQGGLGNQLFGWAAGLSLSMKLNTNLTLNSRNLIARGYELDEFKLSDEILLDNSGRNRFSGIKLIDNTFEEESFQYDERFKNLKKPKTLKGYFQSWKYFDEFEDKIKSLLVLKEESENLVTLSEELKKYQILGIHIRRGDYVGLEDYHGLTSTTYFKNAVQVIRKLSGYEKIMVFSDQIEVAKEVFPDGDYYISSRELSSSPETLILMSRCESLIGSNSSFSWWAGYLGSNNSISRIFPRPWFTNTSIDSRDLLPPNWLTLGT